MHAKVEDNPCGAANLYRLAIFGRKSLFFLVFLRFGLMDFREILNSPFFAVTVAGQRFGVGAVKPRKVCAKRQKSDGKFFLLISFKKNDILKL